MSIKVKAVERNVSFDKSKEKWAYVMQAELYNKLTQSKVIQEAALRSGIAKGSINAAWDAIGEVIKAWATEGHSVAIPGLGSMRFGLRATSVNITCYDRNGDVVKRVTSTDDGIVEDPDDSSNTQDPSGGGSGTDSGSSGGSGDDIPGYE